MLKDYYETNGEIPPPTRNTPAIEREGLVAIGFELHTMKDYVNCAKSLCAIQGGSRWSDDTINSSHIKQCDRNVMKINYHHLLLVVPRPKPGVTSQIAVLADRLEINTCCSISLASLMMLDPPPKILLFDNTEESSSN